ncbi:hypothetical protein EBB07_23500 [Paenibacillaceae bacterium]|nr:hypothetical protein EBB07_23500 [Paenibacillaceae bacterium]
MLHNKKKPVRRGLFLLVTLLLVAALAAGCGNKESTVVVATYKDGGQVTESEFNSYTTLIELTNPQAAMFMSIPQYKEQELEKYVLYKSLAATASDDQKKEAEKEAKDFRKELDTQTKKQKELKQHLKDKNVTAKALEDVVLVMASSNKVISAKADALKAEVPDDEVKAVYDKNPNDYNVITLRHVLVGTGENEETGEPLRTEEEAKALAEELRDKLRNGADWAEIVNEYTEDEGSKPSGGLYEDVRAGTWVEEFKEAATKQEIGVVGDPVETQFGYHVMKVEKRDIYTYDTLPADIKDEIIGGIVNVKVNDYMTDELDKLEVKIDLPKEELPEAPGAGNEGAEQGGEEPAGNGDNAGNDAAAGDDAAKDDAAKDGGTIETPKAE